MFPRSPLQAPALLTCSSPGKTSPGRGCPEAGAPAGPRARGSLASRGQRDPAGEKGQGAGWREPPPLARVDRGSPVRVGASPCLAPGLCGSEVQLSLFSVLCGRTGSRFFYFWKIGLTQHRKKVISGSDRFPLPESRWQKRLVF